MSPASTNLPTGARDHSASYEGPLCFVRFDHPNGTVDVGIRHCVGGSTSILVARNRDQVRALIRDLESIEPHMPDAKPEHYEAHREAEKRAASDAQYRMHLVGCDVEMGGRCYCPREPPRE